MSFNVIAFSKAFENKDYEQVWTRIVSVLICGENANTESLMTFQPFQDSKSFSELNSSSNT